MSRQLIHVTESTGSPGVHWVGHSMGGLLILAHVASHRAPNLASIIAMGSPTDFSKMDTELFGPLLRLKLLLKKYLFRLCRFLDA